MSSRFHGFLALVGKATKAIQQRVSHDDEGFRAMIALSGGPNASAVFDIFPGLVFYASELRLVHARVGSSTSDPTAKVLARARAGRARAVATICEGAVLDVIVQESRGCDLAVIGVPTGPRPFGDPFLIDVARRARCPTLVVRRGRGTAPAFRERRALVVAERGRAGRLGLDRALRWADVAATSYSVLLGPGDGSGEEPGALPERVSSVERSSRSLDPALVAATIEKERPHALIVASNADALENGSWLDDVASRTHLPIAIALASVDGPCTRRRARAKSQAAVRSI